MNPMPTNECVTELTNTPTHIQSNEIACTEKATSYARTRGYLRMSIICLSVLLIVWIGLIALKGRSALRASNEAMVQKETIGAIAYAYQAARCYVPFAQHTSQAYARLQSIAIQAEANADFETALIAWQSIRASILSTQSIFVPFRFQLNEANTHIAWLLAHRQISTQSQETRMQMISYHRAWLEKSPKPMRTTLLVFYSGVIFWIVGFWKLLRYIEEHWALKSQTPEECSNNKKIFFRPALSILLCLTGLLALSVSLLNA